MIKYDRSFLTELSQGVEVVPLSKGFRLNEFDCGIKEYNLYITDYAFKLDDFNLAKTDLLINKENADVVGYISLCMDSIRLSGDEKTPYASEGITFEAIPALKIAKLAVCEKYQKKGYATFLIEIARALTKEASERYGCKFITVDADIRNGNKAIEFYKKNGFVVNQDRRYTKKDNYCSMRLPIFDDVKSS